MGRISQILLAVLAVGVAAFVSRWRAWQQTNEKLVSLLLTDENDSMSRSVKSQTELYTQLPPVVKRYLAKVLASGDDDKQREGELDLDKIRKIKTLHMHQTGTILLEGTWHPFRAVQTMSAAFGMRQSCCRFSRHLWASFLTMAWTFRSVYAIHSSEAQEISMPSYYAS